MTTDNPLSPDCKHEAYWLDNLPALPPLPEQPLATVDVAVIGSGYTGLNAAIQTSRGGRSTMVMDAEQPGWGCSTRNGGQVSPSIEPVSSRLIRRYGKERAHAIRQEDETALRWIGEFIENENLECDFRCKGLYIAAHTPQHFETLARDAQELYRSHSIEAHPVARHEQRTELGSDIYHGGVVYPRHASLHPARYHRGLLSLAMMSGTHVVENCAVTAITETMDGFKLATQKGSVKARDVVVATNGYTTGLRGWLQRRIIPIGSYIIATEPLPEALVAELFPTDRIAGDTCKVIYYYRTSPDGKRVLFGGRVSARETDTRVSAPKLFADMCRIFPQVADYRITHSWMGRVAYTFDELPHIGVHDGLHYAMGYCGSGVAMASYLGNRLGKKLLGLSEGATAFDGLPHPTRPFYTGNPWFLPAAVAWYRRADRKQYEKAAKSASRT